MGLPLVGRERAFDILKHTGGKIPMKLTHDLREIRGIGKKTVGAIEDFLCTDADSELVV